MTNIATSVAGVMAEVRRLKKADNNAFAKYRYTSVDDFKDAMRPLMSKHGLSICTDELSCDLFDRTDDKGKVSAHAKFTFGIWLEHISGVEGKPERLTVMLPYVGAQTSGAARSYAVKEWLKSRFLASSGDSEDADQHDVSEEMTKAEARALYAELQEGLRLATLQSVDAMAEWAEKRRASIDVMPKDWRLQLQRQYKEGAAQRKAAAPAKPNHAEFLAEIEDTLARAATVDEAEQFFDELDVQSVLSDDEDAMARAFEIKGDRIELLAKGSAAA